MATVAGANAAMMEPTKQMAGRTVYVKLAASNDGGRGPAAAPAGNMYMNNPAMYGVQNPYAMNMGMQNMQQANYGGAAQAPQAFQQQQFQQPAAGGYGQQQQQYAQPPPQW